MADEADYRFGEGVDDVLMVIFDKAHRDEAFGNGRYARNLFEQAINRQALRLSSGGVDGLSREQLSTLTSNDFASAAPCSDRSREGVSVAAATPAVPAGGRRWVATTARSWDAVPMGTVLEDTVPVRHGRTATPRCQAREHVHRRTATLLADI